MSNLAKAIESRFAGSVKNRVRLDCKTERKRGSARASISAALVVGYQTVISTHGTVACTGLLHTRASDGGDERAQEHLIEDRMFYEALTRYSEFSIDEILNSSNSIIRALGMLDSRLGKHRLSKLNVRHETQLVKTLFSLRCECEGLPVVEGKHAISAQLQPKYTMRSAEQDKETKSAQILNKRKRDQNTRTLINALEKGETLDISNSPLARALMECVREKHSRDSNIRALKALVVSSKLVHETYLLGVSELLRNQFSWLRPIEKWKPRSHNPDRQFSSLARHLHASYHVPVFMDKAWLTGNRVHQAWFKHIGAGGNIRTASELPVPLTKMMAHYFLTCPDHYSIDSAFRWGQARAVGADRQMADAIVQSRLSESFIDNDFWVSVLTFFARNPMLDTAHLGPIIDYIWNQKYEPVLVFVARGVVERRGPAQPNFSMKGRTVNSLLQQVERWHQALGKKRAGTNLTWHKSTVADFEFVEGSAERKNMRIWRFHELLSSAELIDEGRQMRHCVATYANSCYRGACGIWSVTVETNLRIEKVLTVEVRLDSKNIRQVRGRMNRLPDAKEREIIQRWAAKERLGGF